MNSYWLVHGNLQHIGEGNARHMYSQFGRILEIYTAVKHVYCLFVFPKSMKIVVKFEASSVISLIPYKSCDHHAPFLRNQIVEMSRPPPPPTRF